MPFFGFQDKTRRWVPRYGPQLNRIPLLFSPLALWHFDSSLEDSSGNGHTLTAPVGTARYVSMVPMVAVAQLYASKFESSSAAFRIAGDITIAMACRIQRLLDTASTIIGCGSTNGAEAYNDLYAITIGTAGLTWRSESGGGVDATYTTTIIPPPRQWGLLVARRSSDVVTLRWAGDTLGTSGALTTPTGGGSGLFEIGGISGDTTTLTEMDMLGVAVWNSALSDAQITQVESAVLDGA